MALLIASYATSLVLLMNDCTWLGTGTNHTCGLLLWLYMARQGEDKPHLRATATAMHGYGIHGYKATQSGNQWPGSKWGDLYLPRPTEHGCPVICSLEGGLNLTISTHEGTCRTGT
jgi:hypothetical protein